MRNVFRRVCTAKPERGAPLRLQSCQPVARATRARRPPLCRALLIMLSFDYTGSIGNLVWRSSRPLDPLRARMKTGNMLNPAHGICSSFATPEQDAMSCGRSTNIPDSRAFVILPWLFFVLFPRPEETISLELTSRSTSPRRMLRRTAW